MLCSNARGQPVRVPHKVRFPVGCRGDQLLRRGNYVQDVRVSDMVVPLVGRRPEFEVQFCRDDYRVVTVGLDIEGKVGFCEAGPARALRGRGSAECRCVCGLAQPRGRVGATRRKSAPASGSPKPRKRCRLFLESCASCSASADHRCQGTGSPRSTDPGRRRRLPPAA